MDWVRRAQLVEELKNGLTDDGDGSFFNRRAELKRMLSFLSAPPSRVAVVTGPIDCGKTLLLKQVSKVWKQNEDLWATSPIFYFDLRQSSWRTPQAAAAHIKKELVSWKDSFVKWCISGRKNPSGGIAAVAQVLAAVTLKASLQRSGSLDLAMKAVTDAIVPLLSDKADGGLEEVMHAFCSVASEKFVFPVFVLDEADRLKNWKKRDLDTFSGSFKSLVKQDKMAYLVLSSSDDFFHTWLQPMFPTGQWRPFGVGWFPEAEARKFFDGYSMANAVGKLPVTFSQEDWKQVYAVCGGSPLLLNVCAQTAAEEQISWKDAADALVTDSLGRIEDGLAAAKEEMGFSGENYKQICSKIVDKGFVALDDVLGDVYTGDKAECRKEVQAMLAASFIHCRYVSAAATYADVKKEDAAGHLYLVMARSPAFRAAMKQALGA